MTETGRSDAGGREHRGRQILISSAWPAARPARPRPRAPPHRIIHIAQPGENLFRIGLAYGIGWQAIMDANRPRPTNIYVGESLIIPVGRRAHAPAPPPDRPPPHRAARPHRPTVGHSTYLIQRGDTLWLIAQRFGVTVGQMMAANDISNPNYIYYGQALVIPGPNAPSDAPAGKLLSVAGQGQALALDCEFALGGGLGRRFFGVSIGELDFLGGLPSQRRSRRRFCGQRQRRAGAGAAGRLRRACRAGGAIRLVERL